MSIFSERSLHIFNSSDGSYLHIFRFLQELFGNQDEMDSFDPMEIIHLTYNAFLFLTSFSVDRNPDNTDSKPMEKYLL